jgi:hypothetical protein
VTTTAGPNLVLAVVVVLVLIAAIEYVRRCLAVLGETPDGRLRYLTRAGWTAVIIFVIPIGGLLFLGFGREG